MKYVPRLKTNISEGSRSCAHAAVQLLHCYAGASLAEDCINQGIGDATGDKKLIDNAAQELSIITGQKAVSTKARKSVSQLQAP
jgi:large subunit ribosomal protein L5